MSNIGINRPMHSFHLLQVKMAPPAHKLSIKAALQGYTNLQLPGGFNNPENDYHIEVACNRCKKKQKIKVRLGNEVDEPRTKKRTVNWKIPVRFDEKCKNENCGQIILVQMMAGKGTKEVNARRNPKVEHYKEIMVFVFEGAKPKSFVFQGNWEIEYVCTPAAYD